MSAISGARVCGSWPCIALADGAIVSDGESFERHFLSSISSCSKSFKYLLGLSFPVGSEIGKRFRIDHFGGIRTSGDAVLGDDVVVRNGVTIGLRRTGVRVPGDRKIQWILVLVRKYSVRLLSETT